jgi:CRP/FNR family transcriptional regulator, cyclic AMP receptor protein
MKTVDPSLLFGNQSPFDIADEQIKKLILEQGKLHSKKKGETIYLTGDPVDNVILVLAGRVQVSKTDANGRSVLIHPAIEGNWVGFVGYFHSGLWPYDLTADSPCELFCLPKSTLEAVTKLNPLIYRRILEIIAYYSCFFAEHLMGFVCKPLNVRVIQAVLSFSAHYQTDEIPLTQSDLAAFLGVTREAVAQQLGQLQKSKLIASGYRKLIILDKALLYEMSSGTHKEGIRED